VTSAALIAPAVPDLVLPPGFDRLGETIQCGPERGAPAFKDRVSPDEPSNSKSLRTLAAADFVPCARCGLRGHVAGDADRCIGLRSTGLGQAQEVL
jgi:hypothetical protein